MQDLPSIALFYYTYLTIMKSQDDTYRSLIGPEGVMACLVGKKIKSLSVAHDDQFLKFSADDEDIVFATSADCCSETWFADIVNPEALIGQIIVSSRELELTNVVDNRSRQEFDQFYGYKLITFVGHCEIIFRNSSNGYYGGNIYVITDSNYIPQDWKLITTDWSS